MNRKQRIRLLDAKIALAEKNLEIMRLKVDHELRIRFAVLLAQKLYLRINWAKCKECEKGCFITEACLESRLKTGKCVFEINFKQLEKLPWPPHKEDEE